MSTITQVVTTLPPAPNSSTDTPQDFNAKANAFVAAQVAQVPEVNAVVSQMNVVSNEVNTNASLALDSKNDAAASELLARGSANYQGEWASQGYSLGQGVSVSGVFYVCKLTHATAQTPAEVSTYWTLNNVVMTSNTAQTISGEKNFTIAPKINGSKILSQNLSAYNVDTSTFISNTLASGAIIERGSNANGEYVKFADGTLICQHVNTTNIVTSSVAGSIYRESAVITFTFPAAFVGSFPKVAPLTDVSINVFPRLAQAGGSLTSVLVGLYGTASTSNGTVGYNAIGRWKA